MDDAKVLCQELAKLLSANCCLSMFFFRWYEFTIGTVSASSNIIPHFLKNRPDIREPYNQEFTVLGYTRGIKQSWDFFFMAFFHV